MTPALAMAQATLRQYLMDQHSTARTIQNYLGALPRLDREVGGLLGPEATVRDALAKWRKALGQRFDRDQITADKIRNDVSTLRVLYTALVKAKAYPCNPATEVPSMSRHDRLPRPMPVDQLELLLAQVPLGTAEHINHEGLRDRTMIELFYNGVRNSEVCAMRADHVVYDTKEETIVLHFIGKGAREGEVVLNRRSARFLALHMLEQFAAADWHEWMPDFDADTDLALLQAVERLLDKRLRGSTAPLFLEGERQMGRRDANRMFETYREAAELPDKYTPHTLRHLCGTELLEKGVGIREVQEMLRHRSIRTTELYTQVRRGSKAVAIEHLPRLSGRLW